VSVREDRQRRAYERMVERVVQQDRQWGRKADVHSAEKTVQSDIRKLEVDKPKQWNK
jgi:hypothetical protein